jgi:hypothetical protein
LHRRPARCLLVVTHIYVLPIRVPQEERPEPVLRLVSPIPTLQEEANPHPSQHHGTCIPRYDQAQIR